MRLKNRTTNQQRFEIVWLPVGQLEVDDSYQRNFVQSWADSIIERFNVDEVRPIDVVARGDAPPYWVENGQHTLYVLEAKGWKEVPCFIRNGTTTVRDEAEHFIRVNSNSKSLSPVQMFKAALVACHPRALEIQKTLEKYGLSAIDGDKGRVRAIRSLESVFESNGPDGLDDVLWVITTAWDDDQDRLANPMLKGMAHFLRNNPKMPLDKLVTKLRRTAPTDIIRKARVNSRGVEMISATSMEIERAYRRRS